MRPTSRKKPIGITGGIATGKSTVCNILREMGHSVDSADEIAEKIYDEPEIQLSLSQLLRCEIPVSREYLRTQMASSSDIRKAVNKTFHLKILEKIHQSEAQFIEVPILIETCILDSFSQVWVVWCDPETQRKRLESRLGNAKEADAWLKTQLPIRAKIAFADTIIRTNASVTSVREDIAKLMFAVCAE